MSPEQAEMSALGVDTRSDIYSLGVLLYELLTGTTPLDRNRMKEAAFGEILRIIKEEEPPKPSTRLSDSGEALASISANRHTEPAKLTKLVKGELDWIVMKSLEKDRNRRYETANGFAMDVQRYLADEPVQACPPSVGYRLRKFVRRNKVALAVTGLVLFFVVLLGSGVGWAVRDRAAHAEDVARERASRQAKVAGQVESILQEVERLERDQKWPEALAAVRRAEAALVGGEGEPRIQERVRQVLADLELVQRLEEIWGLGLSVWDELTGSPSQADQQYAAAFREAGIDLEVLPARDAADRIRARSAIRVPLIAAIDDWAFVRGRAQGDTAARPLTEIAQAIDSDPWRQRVRIALLDKNWAGLEKLAASEDLDRQPVATMFLLAGALYWNGRPQGIEVMRRAQWDSPGHFWTNFRLGLWLMHTTPRQTEEGMAYMRVAIGLRPDSWLAMMNLGNGYHLVGRYDDQIKCQRKAVEFAPNRYTPHLNLGMALAKQGKLDEAVASFRKAIELNPTNAVSQRNLGLTLRNQGNLQEAIAAYRKAIELDPKNPSAHIGLGNVLVNQKKLDDAITSYRKAIELNPGDPGAHINLGNVLARQKKLNEGIACYKKALELDPEHANAHNNLGLALKDQGKLEDAVASFRKAVELDPKLAGAHGNLGLALLDQKKPQEAVPFVRKAVELDPKNPRFHNNLGFALYRNRNLDEAIACYRKAIELDPKFAKAHRNLGDALREQGKLDEAIACYKRAVELDPSILQAHYNLARALTQTNKAGEAIAGYRKMIELWPRAAAPYNNLAWLLATAADAKLREPLQAVALARKAVELDPKNTMYANTLGVAYYRAGDGKAALAALDKSVAMRKGGDGFDWFFLAMAHWQLGEKDKARDWYDRAVRWMETNQPSNDELRRFRAEAAKLLKIENKKE
jgi:superkiller protein 3